MNKSSRVTDERPHEADRERGGTSEATLSEQGTFRVMSSLTLLVSLGKQGVDVQWFHLCHENLVDGQGVGSVLTDLKGRHIWFFLLK